MATLSSALGRMPSHPVAGSNQNSTILHSAPPCQTPDNQFSAQSHARLHSTPHNIAQGQTLSSHSHQPYSIQAPFPPPAAAMPARGHHPRATFSFPNPHATSQTPAHPEPARADRQESPSVDTLLSDIMGDLSEAQQASPSKQAPAPSTWEGRQVAPPLLLL